MRASLVHNWAGFVVCLHTLNLRKDESYIGVVVFRKIPLTTSILHWLPTC